MLSPKVYVYFGQKIKQTYRSGHAPSSHLQEVKNFGKLLHLFSPEKWLRSLTGVGCLQARASSCKALTGKIVVYFWCVKTYKRWSHMAVWLSVCLPRALPLSLFDSLASLCTKGETTTCYWCFWLVTWCINHMPYKLDLMTEEDVKILYMSVKVVVVALQKSSLLQVLIFSIMEVLFGSEKWQVMNLVRWGGKWISLCTSLWFGKTALILQNTSLQCIKQLTCN